MKNKERKKFLKVLELGKNATLKEINCAYEHLKELYTSDESIIISPILDEFDIKEKEIILESIEEAYNELVNDKGFRKESKKETENEVELDVRNEEIRIELDVDDKDNDNKDDLNIEFENGTDEEPDEHIQIEFEQEEMIIEKDVDGFLFKKKREEKGMKVRDIQELLNIPYKDIVHIENEKFNKLPEDGYLRWLIRTYAKFLDINENKAAEDYMRKYRFWKKENT
ncbi:MAG: helix-turn-helix domain-containing protein [Acidobacteriota bacterium]